MYFNAAEWVLHNGCHVAHPPLERANDSVYFDFVKDNYQFCTVDFLQDKFACVSRSINWKFISWGDFLGTLFTLEYFNKHPKIILIFRGIHKTVLIFLIHIHMGDSSSANFESKLGLIFSGLVSILKNNNKYSFSRDDLYYFKFSLKYKIQDWKLELR